MSYYARASAPPLVVMAVPAILVGIVLYYRRCKKGRLPSTGPTWQEHFLNAVGAPVVEKRVRHQSCVYFALDRLRKNRQTTPNDPAHVSLASSAHGQHREIQNPERRRDVRQHRQELLARNHAVAVQTVHLKEELFLLLDRALVDQRHAGQELLEVHRPRVVAVEDPRKNDGWLKR